MNNKTSEHSQQSESSGGDNKSGLCIGNIFGLDVGGTLTKLVYFERVELSDSHNSMHKSFSAVQDRYDTRDLIKDNNLHINIKRMGATGGGAHKYARDWERIVGIQMNKHK